MAILAVKLEKFINGANLELDEDSMFSSGGILLINLMQQLRMMRSPEVAAFTQPAAQYIDEETVYYIVGIEAVDIDGVKIKTLLDIGRQAAKCTGIHAAIAFNHPDDIRGSDLQGMGGFSAIMDMIASETERFTEFA